MSAQCGGSTLRISPALDHAIRTGAWELTPAGHKLPLKPGRLVRIACYQRYGLTRTAKILGISQNGLASWLQRQGIVMAGKGNRRRRPPIIGGPASKAAASLYLPGRR
jgi:hypothetical protein